jgi:hypothetical protein
MHILPMDIQRDFRHSRSFGGEPEASILSIANEFSKVFGMRNPIRAYNDKYVEVFQKDVNLPRVVKTRVRTNQLR